MNIPKELVEECQGDFTKLQEMLKRQEVDAPEDIKKEALKGMEKPAIEDAITKDDLDELELHDFYNYGYEIGPFRTRTMSAGVMLQINKLANAAEIDEEEVVLGLFAILCCEERNVIASLVRRKDWNKLLEIGYLMAEEISPAELNDLGEYVAKFMDLINKMESPKKKETKGREKN